MGSDLVAIGFGDLLDQSVGAEDSQLPADRRGASALFFQRERGIGMDWPVQQGLEVSVPEAPDEELSSIDGIPCCSSKGAKRVSVPGWNMMSVAHSHW